MSQLKDMYNLKLYDQFSDLIKAVYPQFDKGAFVNDIFTPDFEKMELKERMRHSTLVLRKYMPDDFVKTSSIFTDVIDRVDEADFEYGGFAFMIFPDYIELYGINDYKTSIKAFERITQFISCEFAVRPFIIKYSDRMIEQMMVWSSHPHDMVRRLSSEGIRPRLPWAMGLPDLKKDPSQILPILENLKTDSSESVRRSVANNLNDIAKDNPEIVIEIAKRWKGKSDDTDKLVKHACRTLFKQGHPEILELYGLNASDVEVSGLEIKNKDVEIGGAVTFSFEVENKLNEPQDIRVEYAIYYMKANGKQAPKVFKISERTYEPNEKALITRNQSFRLITTRKFHVGEHAVSLIVNGKETLRESFVLYN